MQIDQLKRIDYLTDLPDYIDAWVIQAAIDGVREELIPYDEKFEAVFEKVVPNGVIFVQSLNNDDDYFAVTFINNSAQGEINKSIPKNEDKANYDKASVVILIDAEDGSFKEASWTENPAKYLPLSDDEAIEIALVVAEKLGIEVIQHNLQPELVHRRLSPYYPEWRFIMNPYEVYISQEGFASVEELGDGGKGGGPMSEDGSIAYSFSTGAPSPFTKATNICYSIAQPGHVSLNIYDVSGRLVKILVQEDKDVGVYSIQWNGCDNNNQQLAPGVYFTKLASGDFVSVKKLILMK
jgi:hypothetical protein